MDDTYLKTIFWLIVIMYSAAIIGIWENFIKPLWFWSAQYLAPFINNMFGTVFK